MSNAILWQKSHATWDDDRKAVCGLRFPIHSADSLRLVSCQNCLRVIRARRRRGQTTSIPFWARTER